VSGIIIRNYQATLVSVFAKRSSGSIPLWLEVGVKTFARRLILPILCASLSSCGGSQGSAEVKPVEYKSNVSHLKAYDRLGSATFVTNFVWWDSTGISRQLHDYLGSPVVVTFWRSSVPASIQELRDVGVLAAKYRDSGIVFLGISLEEKGPRQEMFDRVSGIVSSNGINFQQIIGSSELASSFGGIDVIPTVLLVTVNDRIGATLAGSRSSTDLDLHIHALIQPH
jgi:thiol-disulfide isomerase/thioredoxin